MNPAYYIICILPLLIVWIGSVREEKRNKRLLVMKMIKNQKENLTRKGELSQMVEFAKQFIGKECIIYTFNDAQIAGTVKEVSDSAILVDNNGSAEVVNLAFVFRIREYPRSKNGKKKSVVID